jgi:hypothetical protein
MKLAKPSWAVPLRAVAVRSFALLSMTLCLTVASSGCVVETAPYDEDDEASLDVGSVELLLNEHLPGEGHDEGEDVERQPHDGRRRGTLHSSPGDCADPDGTLEPDPEPWKGGGSSSDEGEAGEGAAD